jgi:hypothetical protein
VNTGRFLFPWKLFLKNHNIFFFFRRHQIIREITQKISEIQNAALGEARLRELNDNINNLLNEKQRWETRIKDVNMNQNA